jgi:ABC-type multidrug transport system permease subunit
MTFLMMILLPIMATFMVVSQYNEATKVSLTLYADDPKMESYVSRMLKNQNVEVVTAKHQQEAMDHQTNLGIVLTQKLKDIYQNPQALKAKMYEKDVSFNSKTLEVKMNSILSTIQTLAKNSATQTLFEENLDKVEKDSSTIGFKTKTLGNPNAVILTSAFNMVVFVMIFWTMTSTLLFLDDKFHSTTQRFLLTTKSKFSYYVQTIGVFALIGVMQFLLMLVLLVTVFKIDLGISAQQLLLLIAAYGLLNIIAAGLGLLLVSVTTKKSTGQLLAKVVALPLAMLGGTLWPAAIMPEAMQKVAAFLPTYWLTEINNQLFTGLQGAVGSYFIKLMICTVVIFGLLSRVRSENV